MTHRSHIRVVGARQHNLKNITVEIPRGALTVITGPSGSGKSSLAFDIIHAEGRRKYVESLSAYARQFLEQLPKPDVDRIEGLTPTIAIEQRVTAAGPRSTVATSTEIHDYLRVLFARAGEPRCWKCHRPIVRRSISQIVDSVMAEPRSGRLMVLAPLTLERRGGCQDMLTRIVKEGFVRVRLDGRVEVIEEIKTLPEQQPHTMEAVVDRLTVKPEINQRLADSIETATRLSSGRVVISHESEPGTWRDEPYSTVPTCPIHAEVRLDDLSPQLFSFNSPSGACERCHGLGITLEFDQDLIVPDRNLSLKDGAVAAGRQSGRQFAAWHHRALAEFGERYGVSLDVPFRDIPEPMRRVLLDGAAEADAEPSGAAFEGIIPHLMQLWETAESEPLKRRLSAFLNESPCTECWGARLRPEALCVKIQEKSIAEVARFTVVEADHYFSRLEFSGDARTVANPLVEAVRRRLRFLQDAGVEYLTLDRPSDSLSGGEWQRIRLATQLGGGLSGITYVLDEPTVGLHPRDSRRLTDILQELAALDNTVIVVEHDEEVIACADYVIDIGPAAGAQGGYVVAEGTRERILIQEDSLTADYLTGRRRIPIPEKRRSVDQERCVELQGVTANNLKNINVRFPLGCFICVTGVSGSGKSTLVSQVLLRALKRLREQGGPRPGPFQQMIGGHLVSCVIEVDQSPIGRTPRGNPATYVGVFGLIRQLYSRTREARIRGYGPNRFSFNVKGGRCEHCAGRGIRRISMHFMPDVFVPCGECGGTRYNRETLEVCYRGRTIADVLAMSVDEAVKFFGNFTNIRRRLQVLHEVGLGYVTLGQSSQTLSGGEAQRVKLASELHREPDGHTMYVLDEPTTGLHYSDVSQLLIVLNRLVDRGQTIICIEHNLDVILSADWIIDLGPEGGEEGGRIVAEGTPEAVAACEESYTGRFLARRFSERAAK